MPLRYNLRCNRPEKEVDWLRELESWSTRTHNQFQWEHSQTTIGTWEARFILNGQHVPDIVGEGRSKKLAETHAIMQLDASPIPILTAS
ncbi:hypothetical protein BDV93DRAFT_523239 [Ceratobasidium sp. AG-I]|nr:hypothetical protein BDV93DRAFT_523239 [Ceratobasidium sp. AG-I]